MCRFSGDDTDASSDTCLAIMCIVVCAGLVKVTQTLRLIPACYAVCCAYKFDGNDTDATSDIYLAVYCCVCRVGEGDTDTMSDIYLAMMCIVECTSLVEMTQILHLISVLL